MSEVSAEEEFGSPGGGTHPPLPFCSTGSPCSNATVSVTAASAHGRFVKLALARVGQEVKEARPSASGPGAQSGAPLHCVLAAGD